MRYAVIIPVFNEHTLFPKLFERLLASEPPRDQHGRLLARSIYVVDDGSSDGTPDVARVVCDAANAHLFRHDANQGKGAAVRTGIEAALAEGVDVVLIQDADLEYHPDDHRDVLAPIIDGAADVVIGSRLTDRRNHHLTPRQYFGNRLITAISNGFTGLRLTDIECCSKAITREVMEQIRIEEDRFGIEPELVAKAARARVGADGHPARIVEVPVTYAGRGYEEGKKITWRDGVAALRCIVRYSRDRP